MKLKYIALIVFIGVLFVPKGLANGVLYKDTIRLNMPNNVIIEQLVFYRNPKDLKLDSTFKKYLGEFLNDFDKIETEGLSDDHPMKIVFKQKLNYSEKVNNTISFSPYTPTTSIIIDDNDSQIFIDKRIHLLELSNNSKYNDSYKVFVHFNSINQLRELLEYDFDVIDDNLANAFSDEQYKKLKRKAFTSWIDVDENKNTHIAYNDYVLNSSRDEIVLSANAALNNVKGDWLGSFQTHMSVVFSSKIFTKQSFNLSYEWMYNFTSPNEKTVDGFLDLGYSINTSSNPDKEKWFGMQLGYLIDRNSEFFEKNTCRLSFLSKINDGISIGPQMYFNGFFKDVYPGINLNVSLF